MLFAGFIRNYFNKKFTSALVLVTSLFFSLDAFAAEIVVNKSSITYGESVTVSIGGAAGAISCSLSSTPAGLSGSLYVGGSTSFTPNSTGIYTLSAYCRSMWGHILGWTHTSLNVKPLPPGTPYHRDVNPANRSFVIDWNPSPSPVTHYQLQESTNGGATWSRTVTVTGTAWTATSKSNGSTYTYRVLACGDSLCTPSGIHHFRLPYAAPGKPGTPKVNTATINPANRSFTITWSAASGTVSYYNWRQSQNGGTTWTNPKSHVGLSLGIGNLTNGATYHYRVQACNTDGCGPYSSDSAGILLPYPAPTVSPGGLTAPAVDEDGSYTVSWNSVQNANYYRLEENGSVQNVTGTSRVFGGATAKPRATYTYRVMACNASGCGGFSPAKITVVTGGADSGAGSVSDSFNVVSPPPTGPAPGTPVGSIAGQFRVDESGAATYTIPLALPKGTAGVTPQISLNYSSQRGNGLLGQGWAVGGISAISRCRQTLSQDGVAKPVTWSADDRFCLDGQRLVLTAGSAYGAPDATYKTTIDSFVTVQSHDGTAGRPDYFTVTRKDGSISYYGYTSDSRSHIPEAPDRVNVWSQNRFQDSVGNQITFVYEGDHNSGHRLQAIHYAYRPGSTAAVTVDFDYELRPDIQRVYQGGELFVINQRLRLISVKDTFNGSQNEVRRYELDYRPAPSNALLSNVSKLDFVRTCVDTTCLPATHFEWTAESVPGFTELAGDIGLSDSDNPSYLRDFKFADVNGDGNTDLVYLNWFADSNRFEISYGLSDGSKISSTHVVSSRLGDVTVRARIAVLDYNNDGRQDVAFYWPDSAWDIYLSAPQSDGTWRIDGLNRINTPVTASDANFMDLNSDGLVDAVSSTQYWPLVRDPSQDVSSSHIYHFGAAQTYQWMDLDPLEYSPNGGDDCTFLPEERWIGTSSGDFNGDGRVDFVGIQEKIKVCQNAGHRTQAVYALIADGSSFKQYARWNGSGMGAVAVGRDIVDINADGLADLFVSSEIADSYMLNNGQGFNDPVTVDGVSGVPSFTDYNGDGYLDVYWHDADTYALRVKLWTGSGFGDSRLIRTGGDDQDGHIFMDLDGNSRPDFVYFDVSDSRVMTFKGASIPENQAPNAIVDIYNGLGHHTAIQYGTLGRSGHYSRMDVETSTETTVMRGAFPVGDCNNPMVCGEQVYTYQQTTADDFYRKINGGWELPESSKTLISANDRKDHPTLEFTGAMYVVTGAASSAPKAGDSPGSVDANATSTVSYYYGEAKFQASGRGFLGFHKLKMVDEQSGIATTTTYRQDYPFIGRPLSTQVYSSDDVLLSEARNTWDFKTFGSGANKGYQPYVAKAVEKNYELEDNGQTQGSLLKTVTTVTTPDNFGNPLFIDTKTEGGGETITQEVANLYGSSDQSRRLGRLSSTTVTTTRGTEVETRHSTFSYYTSGSLRDMLKTEVVEPGTDVKLTTEHFYDSFGNETKVTQTDADSESRSSDTTAYHQGRYVQSVTNALSYVTSNVLERNRFGAPTRISNINGVVTELFYDSFGREYLRRDATGAWSWTGRQFCGSGVSCPVGARYRVEERVAGGGRSFTYYDVLGRTLHTTTIGFDGTPVHVATEYDSTGRILRVSNPYTGSYANNGWTETTYDLLGRTTAVQLPNGTSGGTSEYSGYQTTITNPAGQVKTETRNVQGQLVQVMDNLGGTVSYQYDVSGNLLSTTTDVPDANPVTVRMCYDKLGRKVAMHDPDKGGFLGNASASCATASQGNVDGWWHYAYNGFGELVTQTDPKNQIRSMTYDALGRMLIRTEWDGNGAVESRTRWYYDASVEGVSLPGDRGNLTYVVQNTGSLNEQCNSSSYCKMYIYDEYGRETDQITFHPGAVDSTMTGVKYDSIGRPYRQFDALQGAVMPDSGIQQEYNAYGYKTRTVDLATGNVLREVIAMDERGQVTQERRSNGVIVSHYGYDPFFGRLEAQHASIAGALPIQDITYQWNAIGNLKSRYNRSSKTDNTGQKNLQESFCYDGLNRLTKTQQGTSSPSCGSGLDVTYNGLGNITYKAGIGAYAYGTTAGPHAVTQAGSLHYTYDHNGNMVSGDGRTLKYTTFDKPYEISKGNHTTSFRYGPDRSRYQRTDNKNGVITTTLYLGNVERIHQQGSATIKWRRSIAGAVYTITTDLNNNVQSTDKAFVFTDHLGSTDVITNSQGTVLQSQSFDPWGQRRKAESWAPLSAMELLGFASNITERGYTGHEQLDEVGLIHMNGRVYDPKLGRFLQADPLIQAPGNTQSYNRYSYIINNPLNGIDPSGFSFLSDLWDDIRPFVGAIVGIVLCATAGCLGSMEAMALIGGISGAVGAAANGTSIFEGVVLGALSGGAAGTGSLFAMATMGGLSTGINGGDAFSGFLAAGIGGMFGGGGYDLNGFISATVVGGVVSEITGGKFKNGAATAAFMWALRAGITKGDNFAKKGKTPEGTNDPANDETIRKIKQLMQGNDEDKLKAAYLAVDLTGIEIPKGITIVVKSGNSGDGFFHARDGVVELYSGAFEGSVGWLSSTIGHELGHYYMDQMVLDPSNEYYDVNLEHAIIYDWELQNAARTGLTRHESGEIIRRLGGYLGDNMVGQDNMTKWQNGVFNDLLTH